MIQKYLPPNKLLNATSYAELCDFSFMRTGGIGNIPRNNYEDLRDNSTIYCWSSELNNLFYYINQKNLINITLLSGDNDHPSNPNGWIYGWPQHYQETTGLGFSLSFLPPNVKMWLAQNLEIENNIAKPLPIGVTKEYRETSEKISIKVYEKFFCDHKREKILFSNSSKPNNKIQREMVSNIINFYFDEKNATIIEKTTTQEEHFKNIQEHIFVACPPGNGKDSHRVWESLYFGAIPIVEDSPMNRYFAKLFPILVVESWFQITPNYLRSKYVEISDKNWRYDLLDAKNYLLYHGIKIK